MDVMDDTKDDGFVKGSRVELDAMVDRDRVQSNPTQDAGEDYMDALNVLADAKDKQTDAELAMRAADFAVDVANLAVTRAEEAFYDALEAE